jgi:glycerol-3-phosphate acyltransferase PlsY
MLSDKDSRLVPVVLTVLGVIAIAKHRANIRRLIKGTENRINFRKAS